MCYHAAGERNFHIFYQARAPQAPSGGGLTTRAACSWWPPHRGHFRCPCGTRPVMWTWRSYRPPRQMYAVPKRSALRHADRGPRAEFAARRTETVQACWARAPIVEWSPHSHRAASARRRIRAQRARPNSVRSRRAGRQRVRRINDRRHSQGRHRWTLWPQVHSPPENTLVAPSQPHWHPRVRSHGRDARQHGHDGADARPLQRRAVPLSASHQLARIVRAARRCRCHDHRSDRTFAHRPRSTPCTSS